MQCRQAIDILVPMATVHMSEAELARVAYFVANQVDPGSMFVCHTCDNPPCCNPAPLWLGTQKTKCPRCHSKAKSSQFAITSER